MHLNVLGGVRTHARESALKVDWKGGGGGGDSLPGRGIEPASAACWSDALPTELHPLSMQHSLPHYTAFIAAL